MAQNLQSFLGMMPKCPEIRSSAVRQAMERLLPDVADVHVVPFGIDIGHGEETEKGFGYGVPLRIAVTLRSGQTRDFVLHTAAANVFGHDRRSDRAQAMLLAADTFGRIPKHVAVLDVGAISADGRLSSLRESQEFYLLTEYAPGSLYAEDLRQIAHRHRLEDRDRRRCELLATYLAKLHGKRLHQPQRYRRAIRDLIGHGEGIFGIIDGYPDEAPGVPRECLRTIEQRCWEWRWRLREYEHRLAVTHGDFHPFNILFDEDSTLALLDASRGCEGDPADDVCCLAINFLFFALGDSRAWHGGLGTLWHLFWSRYLALSNDEELLHVAAPFCAWRALVLANPTWYPAMPASHRQALLRYAADIVEGTRFDPNSAEALFS